MRRILMRPSSPTASGWHGFGAASLRNIGHAYSRWIVEAGAQPLPDPVLQAGSDGDDTWLHERVRHTP